MELTQLTRRQALVGLGGLAGLAIGQSTPAAPLDAADARWDAPAGEAYAEQWIGVAWRQSPVKVKFHWSARHVLHLPDGGELCLDLKLWQHAADEPDRPLQRFLWIEHVSPHGGAGSMYSLDGEHGENGRELALTALQDLYESLCCGEVETYNDPADRRELVNALNYVEDYVFALAPRR